MNINEEEQIRERTRSALTKTHELAFSLGLMTGNLHVILRDRESVDWFQSRGINVSDLANLQVAARIVAEAFYRQ